MLGIILRTLWRLIIMAAGGIIFWLIIFKLRPYVDTKLPVYLVAILLYSLVVYLVIPTLIRALRLFIKSNHVPHYATTSDGWPSDPVNIAIIARDRKHLQSAMEKAGWYTADPKTLRNLLKELVSIVFNREYRTAPFTSLYLFNRPHDIGFQISTNPTGSARTRHHVRFWRLEEPELDDDNKHHYAFWARKLRHLLQIEKEVWIGAAVEDTHPINIRWRDGGRLIHGVSENDSNERDFIINSLSRTKQIKSTSLTKPGKRIKFRGQQYFKAVFSSDGCIKVITLK